MRFLFFTLVFFSLQSVSSQHDTGRVSKTAAPQSLLNLEEVPFLKFSLLSSYNHFFPSSSYNTSENRIDLKPPSFLFTLGARVHKTSHIFFGLDFTSVRYKETFAPSNQPNPPTARLKNYSMFSIPLAIRTAVYNKGRSRLSVQGALMYTNVTINGRNVYPDTVKMSAQLLRNSSTYNAYTDITGNIGVLYEYKIVNRILSLVTGIDYSTGLLFKEENKQVRRLGIRLGAEINLY